MSRTEALRLMQKGALLKASAAPPDKTGRERLASDFRKWIDEVSTEVDEVSPVEDESSDAEPFMPAIASLKGDLAARIEELTKPVLDPED